MVFYPLCPKDTPMHQPEGIFVIISDNVLDDIVKLATRDFLKDLKQETRYFKARLLIAALVVFLSLLALGWRLYSLQVQSHDYYKTLSQENRIKIVPVPPARGLVYDRNLNLLAVNKPSYQIRITPVLTDDLEQVVSELGQLVEIEEQHLQRFFADVERKQSFESILLKMHLSEDEVARFSVNRHRFPGVEVTAHTNRYYPMGDVNVHALGYVGRIDSEEMLKLDRQNYRGTNYIGKLGVEKYYENLLHGKTGYQHVEINAQGRKLRILKRIPPVPGADLVLTLDAELQKVALQALGGHRGSVVAMEPETGEILAFVSAPAYDPNLFVNGISSKRYLKLREDPNQPLFNRALSGQYPPGSTIKPMVALAGLHHGVIRLEDLIWAGPYFQLPGSRRKYHDWKKEGHGWVDMPKAIIQSSDVYFYSLASNLGIDRMSAFLGQFNFGSRTGLDTLGEAKGILPTQEWKHETLGLPWYPGETIITGIGQGYMTATPLQLALATSVLATRGQRVQPKILRTLRTSGSEEKMVNESVLHSLEISNRNYWEQIVKAMEDVMHKPNGTAYRVGKDASYRIAGKTGTAQVFSLSQDEEHRKIQKENISGWLQDHALFIAFAPVDNPKIAVSVVVENGGSGSAAAAPVAKAVMDYYLLRDNEDSS